MQELEQRVQAFTRELETKHEEVRAEYEMELAVLRDALDELDSVVESANRRASCAQDAKRKRCSCEQNRCGEVSKYIGSLEGEDQGHACSLEASSHRGR